MDINQIIGSGYSEKIFTTKTPLPEVPLPPARVIRNDGVTRWDFVEDTSSKSFVSRTLVPVDDKGQKVAVTALVQSSSGEIARIFVDVGNIPSDLSAEIILYQGDQRLVVPLNHGGFKAPTGYKTRAELSTLLERDPFRPSLSEIEMDLELRLYLPTGQLEMNEGLERITQSVRRIAQVGFTEWKNHGAYGSNLPLLVFDLADEATIALANTYIREALKENEPRVTVENITANVKGTTLNLGVFFRVNTTNVRSSEILTIQLKEN